MGTFQLLLLGLGVTMFLVTAAIPPEFTRAQWFNEQHVRHPKNNAINDNVYCDNEMRRINSYLPRCKSFNSFLNYSLNNVITVCLQPSIACRNGVQNCHKSKTAVPITECELVSSPPICRYSGSSKHSHFVVACDPPAPADDSSSPLLPVHLDST